MYTYKICMYTYKICMYTYKICMYTYKICMYTNKICMYMHTYKLTHPMPTAARLIPAKNKKLKQDRPQILPPLPTQTTFVLPVCA